MICMEPPDHIEWRPHWDGIMGRAWLVNAIDEDRPTDEYCVVPKWFLSGLDTGSRLSL